MHTKQMEPGVGREGDGWPQGKVKTSALGLDPANVVSEPRRKPHRRLTTGLSVRNCVWLRQDERLFLTNVKELWRSQVLAAAHAQ